MAGSTPPFERLLSNYTLDPKTMCWVWDGSVMNSGYGQIKAFGKMVSTHRYSYELHKGEIRDGLHVLHLCDNKLCINPDHLHLGTHSDNLAEASERGLMRSGNNHPNFGKPSINKGANSKQSIQVIVKGKAYGSIKQAEYDLGVSHGTVRYWLDNKPGLAKVITKKEFQQWQNH